MALPHLLRPLPGQSLLGLLVRADQVNNLPLGAVRRAVSYTSITRFSEPTMYASGRGISLTELASLIGSEVREIEETTFLPVLRRLMRSDEPSIQTLGTVKFAVCIGCWNSPVVHLRDTLLRGTLGCEVHDLVLETQCSCEQPLDPRPGSLGSCGKCHRPWGEITPTPMSDLEREMNDRMLRSYRRLLALEVPLREVATRPLKRLVTQRRRSGAKLPAVDMRAISIDRLASITALLDADPDLIAGLLHPRPIPCPNASCPRYSADAWLFRDVESHCPVCGSRFQGQRLLSTFDLDHGQTLPSAARVRRARRRLARWRRDLRAACSDIAAEGREIHVTDAFERAGIPMNANLRATRLGLTAIVRSAEAKRVKATGVWRFVLQGCVRRAASKPDIPWLSRWLFKQGYPSLPDALQEPIRDRTPWYR